NRLYNVKKSQTVLFPEIPCSIDTDEPFSKYKKCVKKALKQLKKAGVINKVQRARLLASALLAYIDEH
ncbi:MAG: hypothetical protein AAGC55_30900, partial [Myxococcota bacterium]